MTLKTLIIVIAPKEHTTIDFFSTLFTVNICKRLIDNN